MVVKDSAECDVIVVMMVMVVMMAVVTATPLACFFYSGRGRLAPWGLPHSWLPPPIGDWKKPGLNPGMPPPKPACHVSESSSYKSWDCSNACISYLASRAPSCPCHP